MSLREAQTSGKSSRPARGARIEIQEDKRCWTIKQGRAPHGARGLKYFLFADFSIIFRSRPARGARIEIPVVEVVEVVTPESRPARGARIEIASLVTIRSASATSRPARGARIEMARISRALGALAVAPRPGRAD